MGIRKSWSAGVSRAAAVLAMLFALSACGGGDGDAPVPDPSEAQASATPDVDRSREFRAKVTAEGTGAAAFTWEGEQTIVLTRVGGPDIEVNLLSAGFRNPEKVTADPALRFRWAFDLLNAYEDKPASHEITGQAVNSQGLRSQAFLIWMKVKDPSKDAVFDMSEVEFLKEFNQLQQPCTVEVGANESTGTLRCPALATAEGEVAGITVTWEEIPA